MSEMQEHWEIGDRVVRPVFMDDGTWHKHGDSCLPNSPLQHGTVIGLNVGRDDAILIRWDDGTERTLLDHGVDVELSKSDEIHNRRAVILRALSETDFRGCWEVGGEDGSHHSRDLLAMCKLGVVEKKRVWSGFSSGHWEYRRIQPALTPG